MTVRPKGRGLFYGRRSGEQQEQSLQNQLIWAIAKASTDGVPLDVDDDKLKQAQKLGVSNIGDLFIDDAITGSNTDRPGINALFERAYSDLGISHIFVYKRDRLQRPDNPAWAVSQETELTLAGITLVFVDGECKPRADGRVNAVEQLTALLEYDRSGQFLYDLSQRMIACKQALATAGFSAGGRPPYGFARFFKSPSGELTRLDDGMRVRKDGCHVVHLPDDDEKIRIWIAILDMKYQGMGITAIAKKLNERGIPSPDDQRTRTDQGVKHLVSGKWNASTVSELCRNPIIIGQLEYGKRSEGKLLRHTKTGHRPLRDDERRGKNKFVRITNPQEERITVVAGFEPLYPVERWQTIQQQMDERSKTQAGIPKHPDPAKYPLSTRVVDLTEGCGSILYGCYQQTKRNSQTFNKPVYKCGRYLKHKDCYHNTVDGEILLKVVLRSLKHAVTVSGSRDELRAKLIELANRSDTGAEEKRIEIERLQNQVQVVETQMKEIARKLAIEVDPSLSAVFREEHAKRNNQLASLKSSIGQLVRTSDVQSDSPDDQVKKALQLLDRLEVLATVPEAREKINPLLDKLQVWVGLDFTEGKFGKRTVRRIRAGMLSIGGYGLPVPLHGRDNRDPTACGCSTDNCSAADKDTPLQRAGEVSMVGASTKVDENGISYTKVSRGDKI